MLRNTISKATKAQSSAAGAAVAAASSANTAASPPASEYAWATYRLPFLSEYKLQLADRLAKIGYKITKLGDRVMPINYPKESLYKMPRVVEHNGKRATIADNCFIASNAAVVGDVKIGRKVYVGYNAIVRANEGEQVVLGESCNVQEKATVVGNSTVGKWSSIEPMAIVDNADIASCSFVGANAIVMKGAKMESNTMLCASGVLQAGATIPSGEVWAGNPAQKIGNLTEDEKEYIVKAAKHMVLLALEHHDSQELTWEEQYDMMYSRTLYADMTQNNQDARVKAMFMKEPPRLTTRSTRTSPYENVEGRHRPSGGWESTQGY